MNDFSIRDKCKISTNIDEDTFVGILCENNDFQISFPMGFHVSNDEKELRKDILLLMSVISSTVGRKDSEIQDKAKDCHRMNFPFQAYLSIIYDYYSRGYYHEQENEYVTAKRGKIDWSRTIKTQKPYIQDMDVYYLDFVTRRNQIKENELITLINEYCVYDAFSKIGWLFTGAMPSAPRLKFNRRLFRKVILEKMQNTFKDNNKILFKSMLQVVDYLGDNSSKKNYQYGTYRFEYVWEALIDRIFGIPEKEEYYPMTEWDFGCAQYKTSGGYDNAPLRPDTIMFYGQDIYVLDAKYYKYGIYKNPSLLPKSTDINKQITYGEYIHEQQKFKEKHSAGYKVYNAFLMPFDSASSLWPESENYIRIGQATGNWKSGLNEYEKIQGIIVDVKHLMKVGVNRNPNEISNLAKLILKFV